MINFGVWRCARSMMESQILLKFIDNEIYYLLIIKNRFLARRRQILFPNVKLYSFSSRPDSIGQSNDNDFVKTFETSLFL